MAHKARIGGEIGANGEFYKGGQFVADSQNTIKGSSNHTIRKCKVEIEPYTWIETDGTVGSLMNLLCGTVATWVEYGDWTKIKPVANVKEICDFHGWNLEEKLSLISKYNNGERTYKYTFKA